MGRLSIAVGVALCALASPAAADTLPNSLAETDDAVKLQPLGAWALEVGDTRCRLARWFGDEDSPHLLVFSQAAPRRAFGFTIAGPQIARFQRMRSFLLGMERDEAMDEISRFGRSDLDDVGKAIVIGTHNIGPNLKWETVRSAGIDLDEAGTIDRAVLASGRRVISFETGNMQKPFEALNACTVQMLARWGLDAEQHQAFTPPRMLDRDEVERRIEARYPKQALSRREEAIVTMTVIVDADGSVSNCMVENMTPAETLNSPACQEIASARFEPARDADGVPMRSYMSRNISYTISN